MFYFTLKAFLKQVKSDYSLVRLCFGDDGVGWMVDINTNH